MDRDTQNGRFTIHQADDETTPDSMVMADAENLRIEKLSNRITLVAVLIPCLLVVVLAVAYLDIKHRVISTQNTGSMGVQNLSKDLDSRFSSLSLKQAKLDEQMAKNTATLDAATAALQVNLKKGIDEMKKAVESKAERSELQTLAKNSQTERNTIQKDLADLSAAFDKFDEELAGQILHIADSLKNDQARLTEIDKKIQRLEAEKLSKESLDLALGLERLTIQEMVKERIGALEKKLTAMQKRLGDLDRRLKVQALNTTPPPPASPPSRPTPSPSLSSDRPSTGSPLEEQTIE